jgi:predicted  nucleic acid-binding Zn-ribbon protein
MQPDIEKLIQLQDIDREMVRLRQEVAAFPKRLAAIEAKLAGTSALVEKAKAGVKQGEQNRRKYEGEILSLQQKISKFRDHTLAVKTNQEYRALLDEIAFSEKEIRALEDKILDGMLEAEVRDKEIKAAETLLASERAAVEKEKAEAKARTAEDEQALAELAAKRNTLRAEAEPELLRHYDRVLKLRGSAMAEVRGEKCTSCHVMLRPQKFQDVRNQQVLTCDSCGRILYYDPSHEPAAEPGTEPVAESSAEIEEPAASE